MTYLIRFSLLISLSFLIGASSCEKKPNAYKCVTFVDRGETYMRCKNSVTGDAFTSDLSLIGKCIKNRSMKCFWWMTDELEFEKARLYYDREFKK